MRPQHNPAVARSPQAPCPPATPCWAPPCLPAVPWCVISCLAAAPGTKHSADLMKARPSCISTALRQPSCGALAPCAVLIRQAHPAPARPLPPRSVQQGPGEQSPHHSIHTTFQLSFWGRDTLCVPCCALWKAVGGAWGCAGCGTAACSKRIRAARAPSGETLPPPVTLTISPGAPLQKVPSGQPHAYLWAVSGGGCVPEPCRRRGEWHAGGLYVD